MQRFSLSCRTSLIGAAFILWGLLPRHPALADFIQQGQKLTAGLVNLGTAVALSADGNTAISGGPLDSNTGAAFVFTRSNGVWSEESKLVALGGGVGTGFGASVALSADGNTAIVGAPFGGLGAVWVFIRGSGGWGQQSEGLVGTGSSGNPKQGYSVALSADGNTALIGGPGDSNNFGAAWVFTRSGSTWMPQGNKLVGTGNSGAPCQGTSVALSADGNTALIGGRCDAGGVGAAWVFTRTAGAWTQYGSKLVGSFPGLAQQGTSVALSGDGLTALIGAPNDDGGAPGGVYVFTLDNGTWTQQTRMAGGGSTGTPNQGQSVTLSGNGNVAVVGGPGDNSSTGAVWVFTRSNGRGRS
jgi:FG-GAP repeat